MSPVNTDTPESNLDGMGRNKIDASKLKSLSFQKPDYVSLINTAIRQLRTADTNLSNDDVENDMLEDVLRSVRTKMRESDEVYKAISASLVIKQDKIGEYVREQESAESVIKRLLGDEVISAKMVNDLVLSVDSNVRELNAQQRLVLDQFSIYGEKMNTRILAKLGLPSSLLEARIDSKVEQFDKSVAGKVAKTDKSLSVKMRQFDKKRKWSEGSTILYSGIVSSVVTFSLSILRRLK